LDFENYKTESLERISADPKYQKHHATIEAILRKREGHLHVKRGIEVLTDVARTNQTTNYKIFFEACVGGTVRWNHTKVGQIALFLGKLQRYCADQDLPILTALVVNTQTNECGAGFLKDMIALGLATENDDPKAVAQKERDRCWKWASSL
jgi:hypothetical protein